LYQYNPTYNNFDESTSIKIDHLLEEGILQKASDFFAEIGKGFQTKTDIQNFIKSEEKAKKRREKYLSDNGIDIVAFKKKLQNGDSINLDWKLLMTSLIEEAKETTSSTTVLKNIMAVGIVVAFNTLFMSIFTLFLPLEAALFLGGIIAAPITEELFKRLSVSKNQGFASNIIFNLGEFTLYLTNPMFASMNILILLMVRLFVVVLHTYWTLTHQKGKMLDKWREDFGIKEAKKDKRYTDAAHKTAMLLHGVNNLLMNPIISGATIAASNLVGDNLPKKKAPFNK